MTKLEQAARQALEALSDCVDDSRTVLSQNEQIYTERYRPHVLIEQERVVKDAETAIAALHEALSGVQALSAAPNGWESVIDAARSGLQDSEPSAFDNSGYRAFAETVLDAVEEGLSALAASPTPPAEQPDLTKLTERGAKAWAGVDAQALRDGTYQQAATKAAPVVWLSSKQLRGVTALHGQYLPFRCQPEGRFDTPVYLVEAATKAAPTLPEGWTYCTIEFDNDGPEVVAYGPKRMMNRLAKWLGKYFARVIADATPKAVPGVQNTVPAEWLEQAYREGWAACRDAETIGEEAEDWAFGNSTANSRMIDAQQAAPQQEAPKAAPAQQEWRLVLPGGKYTDKWESARIGDYNRGWNDYRKAAIAALNSVVWPARASGNWVAASTWLRNNYQDHPDIASLCDAMLEAAPQPAPVPLIADEICDAWEFVTGHQIQFGPSNEGRPMFISTDEVIDFARAIEQAHGITGGQHGTDT